MNWSELYSGEEDNCCDCRGCAFNYKNVLCFSHKAYPDYCDLMHQEYEEAIWEMGALYGVYGLANMMKEVNH